MIPTEKMIDAGEAYILRTMTTLPDDYGWRDYAVWLYMAMQAAAPQAPVAHPTRSDIIDVLLATRGLPVGVAADAILSLIPAPAAPDVAELVGALARCRQQASYSIGDSDALANQLAKVREIVNKALATHQKQENSHDE